MATVSASMLRSKYALAAVLALAATGLGIVGYQTWTGGPSALFGEGAVERGTRSAPGPDARIGGLTGIEVVDDAIDALVGRSPGERTVAVSGKGKGKGPARAYRYARSPAQQALDEAFSTPVGASRIIPETAPPGIAPTGGSAPGIVLPPGLFTTAEAPPGLGSGLPATGGTVTGPGGGVFAPPGGFSVGVIGGGGGTPPGGGTQPPPPVVITPPTAPAIPEPSTWLMLLLGMGSVGAVLRTGKPQARAAKAHPFAA